MTDVELTEADQKRQAENMLAFDFTCRHYLGVPGAEFLRAYKAGTINTKSPDTPTQRVLTMLPFAIDPEATTPPASADTERTEK